MKVKNNLGRKVVALFVIWAMVLSMFTWLPLHNAEAATSDKIGDGVTVYHEWYLNGYGAALDFPTVTIGDVPMNGTFPKMTAMVNGKAQPAFCVDITAPCPEGSYAIGADTNIKRGSFSETQERKIRNILKAVSQRTFNHQATGEGGNANGYGNAAYIDEHAYRIAAQIVIWGIVYNCTLNSSFVDDFRGPSMVDSVWSKVKSYYPDLVTIANASSSEPSVTKPSFTGSKVLNDENGFSISLTDSNGVLSKYSIKDKDGLTVTKSGNVLTISASGYFDGTKVITLEQEGIPTLGVAFLELDGTSVNQNCVTYANIDTTSSATATVSVTADHSYGWLKIKKTSDSGVVSGFEFTIKKGTTTIGTYTSTSTGEILVENLLPGTYTVTEKTKSGYVDQPSKSVTVKAQETAEVSFENETKKGNLSVNKQFVYKNGTTTKDVTSNIYQSIVNDIRFRLHGTSTVGLDVDVTLGLSKVGNDYVANFTDIPIGTYTLSETMGTTASKYLVGMSDTQVTITYNGSATKSVSNEVQKGNLKFNKVVEYGTANTIQFNLKGTSDVGIPIDMTVSVGNKTSTQEFPWMGTINGVKVYDTAKVSVQSGTVTFSNVPVGKYVLTESKYDAYLIPMETKNEVAIVKDKTVDYTGAVNGDGKIDNEQKRGTLQLTKVSENGEISGLRFRLSGTSQSGQSILLEAVTNDKGQVTFENVPIGSNYIITEVNSPDYFVPFNPLTGVKIEWNKITRTDAKNWDKRGDLVLVKTRDLSKYPEYNSLSGFKFRLYGTSESGENVDTILTTDNKGKILFTDILIGNYIIEEIDTPIRYIVPEPQEVAIHWNGKDKDGKVVDAEMAKLPVPEVNFHNDLKHFQVEIVKVDSEKTIAQGDATLEGAIYGIYDGGVLVDQYTTDADGRFTTKFYECGDNWTVKEIKPSRGYKLDTKVYKVGAEAKLYTEDNNQAPLITSVEDVNRGSFLILKTTGNGTGVFEFEEGAEFEVFLSSAGSYDDANDYERDYLTISETGTATTKLLPYGNYTVHQTKAWDGRAFADDYELFVGAVDNSYDMVPINNGSFESRIRVVKVDSDVAEGEEPKVIPVAGAAFQIYNPEGELVVQKITYPDYVEFDTFYTSDNGDFTIPEPLPYGKGYSLVEIEAPFGYVLGKDPIYFDVTALEADLENGYATIVIAFPDKPQKGTIKVDKLGEVFSSVVNNNGCYQPQYSVEHLEGATYAIIAAEDIYTPDGTLRYAQGAEADRITTGSDGTVTSKPLYLGNYNVIEIQAPVGMTLDDTPMPVELVYDNQLVEILDEVEVSQLNDRQKLALNMAKVLEINEKYGLGMNDEILFVSFGLYAGEDVVASDGSMIPRDGLIESQYCNEDGEIEFTSDLPFGRYYVKELSTDKHYILNEEKFEFAFEYQGQDIEVVEVTVNNGNPIPNELFYGLIGGIKVDAETGIGLGGAVIGLFPDSTKVFTKDTAYVTTTTNDKGRFSFTGIPCGVYLVREISAPENYILNEEPHTVSIESEGEEISVTIENSPVRGNIELIKTDADDVALVLSDAEFGVWSDVNNNGVIDDDDIFIGQMTDIDGVYRYDSLRFGSYLVKETKAPKDYILDEGVYSVEITEDGEYYIVTNNEEGTFGNKHTPEIGTMAYIDEGKEEVIGGTITIADTVEYKHLYTDREYTVTGILMEANTNEPLLIDGETVESSITFIPETPDGEVVVFFTFDSSSLLETTKLVVFESLLEDDYAWAVHADIDDEGQTVTLKNPSIKTTATSNDGHEEFNRGVVTIKDDIRYQNLIVGKEYTIYGVLMDKSSGEELLVDGKKVTAETTFVAETEEGVVSVFFKFDSSALPDSTDVVAFERIEYNDVEIAVHTDIEDEDQTIRFKEPSVQTKLLFNYPKMEELQHTVLDDIVSYHNLILGREYTLRGTLRDKNGDIYIDCAGKEARSEFTFIPTEVDGEVSVQFIVDTHEYDEEHGVSMTWFVVAFEELYCNGVKIASHEDMACKEQSQEFSTFPDDDVPKNPPPNTGVTSNIVSGGIVCGVSLGVMAVTSRRKLRRKRK